MGPYNDLAFGLHQLAPYYYWPGWHEPETVAELTVNRQHYESLSQDLQLVIQNAAQAAYGDMLGEYTAYNNGALATLIREHNVKLRQFPNAILGPLGKISQDLVAALGHTDALSQKVYTSFEDFRRKAIDWGQIGEEAYSLARSLTSVP